MAHSETQDAASAVPPTVNDARPYDVQPADVQPADVQPADASAETDNSALRAIEALVLSPGGKSLGHSVDIDAHLREKLSGHRLSGITLASSLAIAGGVSAASLAIDITRLIDSTAWFGQLAVKSGDPAALRYAVARLQLPHELLFRLTVAREQRAELFRHCLAVAIISHYLALRLNLKPTLQDSVLIAALCHDLGELYTDPAILKPEHRVTEQERRFIYVHPITGWLIVHGLGAFGPEVAKAVIQHQERLDGSGYPFAVKAEAIGQGGRILAAADISASIMMRFNDHHRLSTLLRLNSTKYDRQLVDFLHEAFIGKAPSSVKYEGSVSKKRLSDFAQLLEGWSRLRANALTAQTVPVQFLAERMYSLRMVVVACGFDPDSLDASLQLAEEDAGIASELAAVIEELKFQLADLEREIERHAADWRDALDPGARQALDDWCRQLHDCNQY
jgi:HD-GYP domain-containing protein (c-di-GMP phosphodiesterase class II)